ncbi:unnamed protein product [Effrenium voratum]|uniref:Cyclic nucleotide-binding domain-containing protein n=1 Tax=Effrenium voratum TaxID=2562239 RepID=A0AA36IUJ7_9DINO|nr:unnamed protein product [Effrenium voratum]CAJ1394247.1 unnamed protein product [Effrenium voratum]CAJ1422817.1 unnamed protein product [Effrenium voratum]|mmetsp:Transcript_13263/g.31433  ORF Transcript_13263/g.31433 Transcript_13263/m.31433 type:complete len:1424 (-) Transcript_13263:296-4567(-)
MTERSSEDVIVRSLAAQPLFRGCDLELLKRLAAKAFNWTPGRGHEIPMRDEMPLMIVLSGALYMCIGGGPAALASRGTVVGFVGLLRLHGAVARTPSKSSLSVLDVLQESEDADVEPEHEFELPDQSDYSKQMVLDCIRNLCPHTVVLTEKLAAPLRMEMVDALTNERQLLQTEESQTGCCTLACISLDKMFDVFAGSPSLSIFQANEAAARGRFEALLDLGAFPNLPLEVVWVLAAFGDDALYQAGETIVREGDPGVSESLLILASGSADVHKVMFASEILEAKSFKIGKLSPGCIIGDACFIDSRVSRPASVIASEASQVISIPARAFLETMASYPGMASIYLSRTRDTSMVLQNSLTRPADVLAGMRLFHGLNASFIRSLANITERKMNFLGDVFKEQGSTDRTLRLLEFGKVRVEIENRGCVAMTEVGQVLGENMFLGKRAVSQATFRVATPLAVMLWIAHHSFENIIDAYPSEAAHFRAIETDNGTEDMSHHAMDLKLFQGCGRSFIQSIAKCISRRAYKPGQTIVVQKAVDEGSLFIVSAGKAAVVINSQTQQELSTGDVFGELALLGLVQRRAATVSAITYCICLEMPRPAFLKALDSHPEETDHFEQLTRLHAVQVASESGTWPFLAKASDRLLYYVNLHATRESTPPGEWITREGAPLPIDLAFLIVSGEIYITEENGHRTLMPEGSCFGEHILIGLAAGVTAIEPKTACELQMMSRGVFEKVLAECPDERDSCIQGVLDEMAMKAEQKLGITRGAPDVLKFSAFFRAADQDFARQMRPRMYALLFKAGDFIVRERDYATNMYIVVRGSAEVKCGDTTVMRFKAGNAISEASVLGACTFHPYAVQASSLCLLLALTRDDFEEVLERFPKEDTVFQELLADEEDILLRLPRVLKIHHPLFASSSIDFLKVACEFADEVFFAPGEEIIAFGESCSLGQTEMYLLVAGNALVILAHGDVVATIKSGNIVGEGGALGIANKRSTKIGAWKAGMVRLIRLQGPSIGKAVEKHPEDCEALKRQFDERSQKNAEAEALRKEWITKSVIPLLQHCELFNGFSRKLVAKIAAPLLKIKFAAGQNLCNLGDAADSLILIIDGDAEAKAKDGKVVSPLSTGAVTGELAILGLFPYRTATVTALRPTDTVIVTPFILRGVLQTSEAAKKHLDKLAAEKLTQVERGSPMLSLPLGAPSDDLLVRSIALHSTRYVLTAGEAWQPPGNAAASGDHYWVFTRGRAVLLMGPSDHPMNPIQTLGAGATGVLSEMLCLKYDARIVAVTAVEAYRVSSMDIRLASTSVKILPCWFLLFRGLERETLHTLGLKLMRAKAVIDMTLPKVQLKPLKKSRSSPTMASDRQQAKPQEEAETTVFSSTPKSQLGDSMRSLKSASQASSFSSYPTRGGLQEPRKPGVRLRPISASRRKDP